MEFESLGTAKLSQIKKVLAAAEAHNHDDIDMDISVEYLVGSCFPKLWENYRENMREQFNLGFSRGLQAAAAKKEKTSRGQRK